MFLSKDISAYTNAPDWPVWPENTMQGITFVRIDGKEYTDLSRMRLWQRPYISLEPLMGPVKYDIPDEIELVIVGAMSSPGAIVPQPEWIRSVKDHCPEKKIFWKANIKEYLNAA
jgi:protein gp37